MQYFCRYLQKNSTEAALLAEVKQNAHCHLSSGVPNKLWKTKGTFRLI